MATQVKTRPQTYPPLKSGKALLLTLPMALLTAFLLLGNVMGGGAPEPLLAVSVILTWLLFNSLFFLMLKTGKTHRYRAALFIILALAMIVTFATVIRSERGNIALSEADMIQGKTPFCHLVIPMTLIPALLTRTIIFPGSLLTGFASIASMFVIWIGTSLVLGRGWCSWGCFYGGYDEACSLLAKKPRIKKIDARWRYLPYAVLLAIVLLSAVTLSPTYCEWLCPFKAVTEYSAVTDVVTLIQTGIFISLFVGLVVVLPFLTKRRVQCGLFCPFGAFQSFTNRVTIFDVRIDPAKCSQCGLCVRTCPTFSLDAGSLQTGRPLTTCTKCGQCIDACPKQAITYHIKGTAVGQRLNTARLLFLYPAFVLLATMGGGIIATAIYRLLKLVTTGSML